MSPNDAPSTHTNPSPPAATALRVQIAADGIAVVTLDVPGKSVNSLSMGLNAEFEERFAELTQNSAVRAVVLTSAKPDSFVVGADMDMLSSVRTAAEASELMGCESVLAARTMTPPAVTTSTTNAPTTASISFALPPYEPTSVR